jgi:hypothetical protein
MNYQKIHDNIISQAKNRLISIDEYRDKHKLTLMKPIMTPDGIFNSMLEASKHFDVVPATITYRVNSKNEKWYYLTEEDKI